MKRCVRCQRLLYRRGGLRLLESVDLVPRPLGSVHRACLSVNEKACLTIGTQPGATSRRVRNAALAQIELLRSKMREQKLTGTQAEKILAKVLS